MGNAIWGDLKETFADLERTSDRGLILAGYSLSKISGDKTEPSNGWGDYWILKTYSEVPVCNTPVGFFTSNIKSVSAKLNWNVVANAQNYTIRYRVSGSLSWTKAFSPVNSKKFVGPSPSTQYDWEVKAACNPANNVSSEWSTVQNFTTKPLRLEDENDEEEISLEVFPNPVSSSVTILFSLNEDSKVLIELFSIDGRKVITIADENFQAGNQEIISTVGQSLEAGIQFN